MGSSVVLLLAAILQKPARWRVCQHCEYAWCRGWPNLHISHCFPLPPTSANSIPSRLHTIHRGQYQGENHPTSPPTFPPLFVGSVASHLSRHCCSLRPARSLETFAHVWTPCRSTSAIRRSSSWCDFFESGTRRAKHDHSTSDWHVSQA